MHIITCLCQINTYITSCVYIEKIYTAEDNCMDEYAIFHYFKACGAAWLPLMTHKQVVIDPPVTHVPSADYVISVVSCTVDCSLCSFEDT